MSMAQEASGGAGQHGSAAKGVKRPALFVGGGNMALAIITGALKGGVLASHQTVVVDPSEEKRAALAAMGVLTAADAEEGARILGQVERMAGGERGVAEGQVEEGAEGVRGGAVVLAVKPQMLGVVAAEWRERLGEGSRLIVSILAGTTREGLRGVLGERHRYVRTMPNLPLSVGMGMTALAEDASIDAEAFAWVERLFGAAGKTVRIDESMMDAFTALAGSGPAYLFYLAEAMARAGARVGFDPAQAGMIAVQTIAGATEMLVRDGAGKAGGVQADVVSAVQEVVGAALRAAVTSKGGTTHAACTTLDALGVMEAFARAIEAARDRGRELAQG